MVSVSCEHVRTCYFLGDGHLGMPMGLILIILTDIGRPVLIVGRTISWMGLLNCINGEGFTSIGMYLSPQFLLPGLPQYGGLSPGIGS